MARKPDPKRLVIVEGPDLHTHLTRRKSRLHCCAGQRISTVCGEKIWANHGHRLETGMPTCPECLEILKRRGNKYRKRD